MNNQKTDELDQLMAQLRRDIEGVADPVPEKPQDVVYGGLPLAEIMRRVRAEVMRRRASSIGAAGPDNISFEDATPEQARALLPQWSPVAGRIVDKRDYALAELLAYSDEDFIRTAYQVILRRSPDSNGAQHYLSELRSGRSSKVDVLGEMRFSPEGRSRGVHIDGLLIPYTIGKWKRKRFIGRAVRWFHAFARLDSQSSRQAAQIADLAHEVHAMGGTFNRLSSMLVQWQDAIHQQILSNPSASAFQALQQEVREKLDAQEHALQLSKEESRQALVAHRHDVESLMGQVCEEFAGPTRELMDQTSEALALLKQRVEHIAGTFVEERDRAKELLDKVVISDATIVSQQKEFLAVQQRLSHLERLSAEHQQFVASGARIEELRLLSDQLISVKASVERRLETEQGSQLSAGSDAFRAPLDLDPFYAAFEDRFRGDRALVRRRAEPYLDLIREVSAGTSNAPVLDIGCGRGEWLELLRDHGLVGQGIDLNRVFADICRGYGLDVTEGDAVKTLSELPEGSVGAVTSMHLVEHLPFEQLIALLDEARRVLVPGGLIVLETPNPENLSVSSHTFYMDPTHRNPLPPEALRWIVEARGFHGARIERLTVARELTPPPLLPDDVPGAHSINALLASLGVAPDYAIVARKP